MSAPDMPAPEMWVRAEDAVTCTVGDELFMALPGEGSIHTLNAMAAAVWRASPEYPNSPRPTSAGQLCLSSHPTSHPQSDRTLQQSR